MWSGCGVLITKHSKKMNKNILEKRRQEMIDKMMDLSIQLGNHSITHHHLLDFFKKKDADAFVEVAKAELGFEIKVSASHDNLTWQPYPIVKQ